MENNEQKVLYKSCSWLNDETTSSTGSVVCCHTLYTEDKESYESMFVEVSDCHVKARLHKTQFENKEQFINKLQNLYNEIGKFIEHLKK